MNVSIIIPAYNSATYLAAAIKSAIEQTRPAAEVIVIDDGSTDDTAAVCQPLADRVVYCKKQNQGVSAARNYGAALSRSEWLLFLDSDDRLLPHAIESLLASARTGSCRVVYGYVLLRGRTPIESRLHGHPFAVGAVPLPAVKNFWRSVITIPGAALVHRSLHQEVGGFVSGYEPMEGRDY
jgi:glycosyltransferase involved in cell wall biosynthesis